MPYECDPCVCPDQHYRDSMSWRKAVLKLLCAIKVGESLVGNVIVDSIAAGDNNIGNVDIATMPAVQLASGTNLLGRASSSLETSTVYAGTTALTPKVAFANVAASSTDQSLVAAVANKKIRVLKVSAQCGATATNLTFNSKPGGAGVAISMTYQNGVNGGEVLPSDGLLWFETVAGEALTVTTGAGSTTGVHVVYVEV